MEVLEALLSSAFFLCFFVLSKKKPIHGDRKKREPGGLLLSPLGTIVAVMMLNFRVRYGYGCVHHAIATRFSEKTLKPDTINPIAPT